MQKFSCFILKQNGALAVLLKIAFQMLAQSHESLLLFLVQCYSDLDSAKSKLAPKSKLNEMHMISLICN